MGALLFACARNVRDTEAGREGDWQGCAIGMFTSDGEAQFPANGEALQAFRDAVADPYYIG